MSKSLLGFLLGVLFVAQAKAEQPIFNISSADANPAETVEINFNVDDFVDIISAQFSINWDPAVLQFTEIKNLNSNVPGLSVSSFNLVTYIDEGKITFGWFESSLTPVTLPDGSLFLTMVFEVIGDPCESSPVSITSDPLEIEVSDEDAEVGLVSNNGEVNVPGTGCSQGINFIGNSINGTCGSEVCISFTVENFTDVATMEYSLVYDPAVIQFDRFQNFGPLLGFGPGNTNNLSPGLLRVVWFNSNAENESLPDGTVLFEICFDVIGSGGQSSSITFGNDPPVMIADIDQNLHTVNIQPAVITAQCLIEGFAFLADTACVQPGEIACIDISVNDFEDIVAFQLSINWDSTKFVFDHVEGFNLPGLDAGAFGVPDNPDVDEGELTVSWIDLSLDGVTVPDLSSIFTLCLRAVGPASSSSAITFSQSPLEIEVATLDSVLEFSLVHGLAQIKLNCDDECFISYTLDVTDPACPGESTGALNLNLDTGNCPDTPTFLWSFGNATTEDLTGVPAGTYSVTITLGTQVVVATDVVTDPVAISVTSTITDPVPAGSNTGAINITVAGGMAPYSFLWSNGSPNEDLTNIAAGIYTVTITDAKGCVFVPDPFVVGADVVGAITHATCPGTCNGSITVSASFGTQPHTYLWNTVPAQTSPTATNLCPGTYCVTITDSGGSSRDTCFTIITQTPPINVTATITHDVNENGQGIIDLNVTGGANPIAYLWTPGGATTQDIFMLPGGQYCVDITYGQNCEFDTCFTVISGTIGLVLNVTQYGNFETSCHDTCDGEITSVVIGAVEPVTYIWSNGATTPDLDNLCPGIYSLTITDADGKTATATRTITAPPDLNYTVIKTDPSDVTSNDGAISINATGGVPPYTYIWVGPVTGNAASMINLPAGTYLITVRDANGCEFTSAVVLQISGIPCYAATRIITPNDDGKNDFFVIQCIFDHPNHLSIYNRNGGLVYDVSNYTNSWTGVDEDNQPVPDGGYLWVLEINDPAGPRLLKGTVNVLRTAD